MIFWGTDYFLQEDFSHALFIYYINIACGFQLVLFILNICLVCVCE